MSIDYRALHELVEGDTDTLAIFDNAIDRIMERQNRIFAISGKKGSGKDTFTESLAKARGTEHLFEAFARPVKQEANTMFETIRGMHGNFDNVTIGANLIGTHNLGGIPGVEENIGSIVSSVIEDIENGINTEAYRRSPGAWTTLRTLGTDIRRAQDDNYWVRKTAIATLSAIHAGVDVYITDTRFPNELDASLMMDATTIRMVVSPEVQRERLLKRDGTLPTDEALNHPSEVSLDDRTDFDFFIDNNGSISIADNVAMVIKAL